MGLIRSIIPLLPKLDPITLAYVNKGSALGYTALSASYTSALDKFVKQCRTDGNITLLDRLWLFATETQNWANLSLVNPNSTLAVATNSPTWTANQGYTGDGSTKYVDLKFTLSTQAVNFTLNSNSFGCCSRTSGGITAYEMGSTTGTGAPFTILRVQDGSNNMIVYDNYSGGNGTWSTSNSNALGLFSTKQTASNNNILYRNATSLNSGATNTAVSLATNSAYALGYNRNALTSPSTRQLAMVYYGGAMDIAKFSAAWDTFATSIGFKNW